MFIPLRTAIPGYIRLLQTRSAGKVALNNTDTLMHGAALFLGVLGFSMSYYSTRQMQLQQKSVSNFKTGAWWRIRCSQSKADDLQLMGYIWYLPIRRDHSKCWECWEIKTDASAIFVATTLELYNRPSSPEDLPASGPISSSSTICLLLSFSKKFLNFNRPLSEMSLVSSNMKTDAKNMFHVTVLLLFSNVIHLFACLLPLNSCLFPFISSAYVYHLFLYILLVYSNFLLSPLIF